jgi:hypothetical protein
MADLLIGLLAAGYALVLVLPLQIRRSWEKPWLPFGLGGGLTRVWSVRIRLAWVPA